MRILLFLLILGQSLNCLAQEAEDQIDFRMWHDQSGKFSIRAKLLEVKEDKVRLLAENGSIKEISIHRLSGADAEYCQSRQLNTAADEGHGRSSDQQMAIFIERNREILDRIQLDAIKFAKEVNDAYESEGTAVQKQRTYEGLHKKTSSNFSGTRVTCHYILNNVSLSKEGRRRSIGNLILGPSDMGGRLRERELTVVVETSGFEQLAKGDVLRISGLINKRTAKSFASFTVMYPVHEFLPNAFFSASKFAEDRGIFYSDRDQRIWVKASLHIDTIRKLTGSQADEVRDVIMRYNESPKASVPIAQVSPVNVTIPQPIHSYDQWKRLSVKEQESLRLSELRRILGKPMLSDDDCRREYKLLSLSLKLQLEMVLTGDDSLITLATLHRDLHNDQLAIQLAFRSLQLDSELEDFIELLTDNEQSSILSLMREEFTQVDQEIWDKFNGLDAAGKLFVLGRVTQNPRLLALTSLQSNSRSASSREYRYEKRIFDGERLVELIRVSDPRFELSDQSLANALVGNPVEQYP